MKKWIASVAALAGAFGVAGAQAGNVYWSIGINAPPAATVISNAPVYVPAPTYHVPAPVYYQPAPVYYQPAPTYVQPPVIYRPAPVYVPPAVVYRPTPVVVYGGGHGHHWKGHGHDHGRGHWQRRDEYGSQHRGGWDERRRHH